MSVLHGSQHSFFFFYCIKALAKMNLYQEPKQFLLLPKAYEGVMVPSNKKQAVPLKVANPDQPIALADLAELFKYNVWRKIAKHLGLAATGKLQDIVDRVVAAWLERGDLVQFVPGGKGVESIPLDDVNDPSAPPVPSGGTNDPVVPRETIVADRLPIVADFLAKLGLDLFQISPKGAAEFIHGDEASPVLLLQTANLLRQGHPGINFLISSPTPRPREAAMILLEGALLHDTTVACAEAVLSIPGIQDFISADPSNASLLFLGTDPPPPCLVQVISKVLSSEGFQAILPHSTSSAASYLAGSIAGVMVDDDEVARDPDRKPIAAATPASKGTKSVSVASAPEPSKPSPSSPSDQVASKRDVRSFADWFQEKRIENAERRREDLDRQRQYRREDQERFERAEKNQNTMMSMLNKQGSKIEKHDATLEDHDKQIRWTESRIRRMEHQVRENTQALIMTPFQCQRKIRRELARERARYGVASPNVLFPPAAATTTEGSPPAPKPPASAPDSFEYSHSSAASSFFADSDNDADDGGGGGSDAPSSLPRSR